MRLPSCAPKRKSNKRTDIRALLKILVLSFRRRPESSIFNKLDTGFCRCDEFLEVPINKKGSRGCLFCSLRYNRQAATRFLNSLVRVSISILSPISQNAATGSSIPVLILAGFITLPEVSPRTAGSV
ncbi:MAG: hypothetical protein FD134_2186 [Gallionellaceae bacterium]|nr:MAG: hypothetical protein FD134_2186 [Gallionellaceae bacterium]